MILGLVNGLRLIENINTRLDYMEITIDGIGYMMFGDYSKDMKYISGMVLYDTMPDMYQGKLIERIVNIAEERVITTVKAEQVSKLLPASGDVSPVCNFEFGMLSLGSRQPNVICYLSSFKEDCSDKARWYDLRVVDMRSKVYTLRYFSSFSRATDETRDILNNLVGKYIKTDITYTQWGYQVDKQKEIELWPIDVVLKPEVEIAADIIEKVTANDDDLREYMKLFNYVYKMKHIIDVEPGYNLVSLAMELMMITDVDNMTDTFMKRTLIRAAVTSRGYMIDQKNNLSKPVLNVNKVLRSQLKNDMDLINTLDAVSSNTNSTKRMYIWISKFVKYIIDERRGLIDEEKIISDFNTISSSYGGLL